MNLSFASVRARAGVAFLAIGGLGACGQPPEGAAPDELLQVASSLTAGETAFDATSCTGTPLTRAEFLARFAPGTSEAPLSTYEIYQRMRSCSPYTGCTAWGTPFRPQTGGARSQPIGGKLSLGIDLRGSFAVWVKDGSIKEMTGHYPDFPAEGASTLTYRPGGTYRFEWLDQAYDFSRGYPMPVGAPVRRSETLRTTADLATYTNDAQFEITALTGACARIVSVAGADATQQYALVVRY